MFEKNLESVFKNIQNQNKTNPQKTLTKEQFQ